MSPNDAKACILHLHGLYPKASTHWAAPRQQAFRDQLGPLHISVEQFRAAASDVAMTCKATWCPPEAEILRKLRGLAENNATARRVEQTKRLSGPQPGDRLHSEWAADFRANPGLRENLNPAAVRLLMRGKPLDSVTRSG